MFILLVLTHCFSISLPFFKQPLKNKPKPSFSFTFKNQKQPACVSSDRLDISSCCILVRPRALPSTSAVAMPSYSSFHTPLHICRLLAGRWPAINQSVALHVWCREDEGVGTVVLLFSYLPDSSEVGELETARCTEMRLELRVPSLRDRKFYRERDRWARRDCWYLVEALPEMKKIWTVLKGMQWTRH